MTHILHRSPNAVMPVAVSGSGVEIVDAEGRRYLDASGGAAVSCLGHGHPDVLAAMRRQLEALAYAHTSFFTTEVAERLADRLIEDAPPGLSHVYLVSGGSEAIEAALKMARQYFVEIGQPQRRHVIARRQSYHGNTLGALAVGGNAWRRAQFEPLLIETHHIDPCYAYRMQREGESDADYAARAAQALEDKLVEIGPDRVIAFVAETVVGATAGAVPPVGDYFKRIRAICDRYGVLLILDEVMCGMGRTGTLHACEQEGVAPDLMAIAKGLGGGYQPIGAVMLTQRIYEAFANGSGAFQHGHTYMGHPMAAAAALAVQDVIRRDQLLANVVGMGARLERRLKERFGQHPFRRRHSGSRPLLGARAGQRPRQQTAVRSCGETARAHQARGDGSGPDGLSDGRDGRWRSGRSCSAGPAFHRRGEPSRRDRRAPCRLARGRARRCPIAQQRSRARHTKSAVLAESGRFPNIRALQPPIRRLNDPSKGLDFVARRFRRPALLLVSAMAAAAAFAQQAPLDLTAPAVAAQKSAKSSKGAPAPIPADEAVARANAWLDAARVMSADFVQIGPNGRRSEGQLSVARPGHMRFEYTDPPRFEIVADGRSVAIVDKKLNTQDEYFIGQTPLKFLLSDHIDLARDTQLLNVSQEGKTITIELEDRAALGGTAHLSLVFDASTFALKQWTVIDAQGFQTVVTLFNVDLTTNPDPALFHIDENLPANQLGNRRR